MPTDPHEQARELQNQLLLDVQMGPGTITAVELNPAEQRVVELITRACAGSLVMWFSLQQLVSEINSYRAQRNIRGAQNR